MTTQERNPPLRGQRQLGYTGGAEIAEEFAEEFAESSGGPAVGAVRGGSPRLESHDSSSHSGPLRFGSGSGVEPVPAGRAPPTLHLHRADSPELLTNFIGGGSTMVAGGASSGAGGHRRLHPGHLTLPGADASAAQVRDTVDYYFEQLTLAAERGTAQHESGDNAN